MIVLDASAMVELLLGRPAADTVAGLLESEAAAPAHFDAEVLGGLARAERLGLADGRRIERGVRRLSRAAIERVPIPPLLADAWRRRANLSLADALYVALAAELGEPLITCDHGLAAAPTRGVSIMIVG